MHDCLLPKRLLQEDITHNSQRTAIDCELIEMEPTGPHEQVSAFIGRKLNVEISFPQFLLIYNLRQNKSLRLRNLPKIQPQKILRILLHLY